MKRNIFKKYIQDKNFKVNNNDKIIIVAYS